MPALLGINGFGRIGMFVFRAASANPDVQRPLHPSRLHGLPTQVRQCPRRINCTIAMSEEDRKEFFVLKRDRNQIFLVFVPNLQITTTNSINWLSLGTLLLVFSCPRTLVTHTSSSSFQTTTSSRSARWLRSFTCCKCGIRRMVHEPYTPKLHRHSGRIKGGRKLFSA